jgi:hypothetical protein
MVLSVHLTEAPAHRAVAAFRRRRASERHAGTVWAQRALTVPLAAGPRRPPLPYGSALLAAWEDDGALDRALAAEEGLTAGWHARLEPLRSVGRWSGLPGLPGPAHEIDTDEPVAVLTLGRLRPRRAWPFVRASQPAERQAIADPSVLLGTALVCPPRFVATFSLWRSAVEMRRYATAAGSAHVEAMRAHAREPFHDESLFARFRIRASAGRFREIAAT